MYSCVYIYIYIYIYMYIYLSIYIYIYNRRGPLGTQPNLRSTGARVKQFLAQDKGGPSKGGFLNNI